MTQADANEPADAAKPDGEKQGPSHPDAPRRAKSKLAARLLLATGAIVFLALFLAHAIFRGSYPEVFRYGDQFLDVRWGLFSTVVLLVGSLTMAGAAIYLQRHQWQPLVLCLGLTLGCGLVFLGTKAVEFRNAFHNRLPWNEPVQPLVPANGADAAAQASPKDFLADLPPELHEGYRLFTRSCMACHGRGGEGVTGAGLPLAGSTFISERSDAELLAFLKEGRMPDDPDSKLGLLMPPRGGNPRLSEDDLSSILQYVRSLAPAQTDGDDFASGPAVPRSVLTEAGESPSGLRREVIEGVDDPARSDTPQDVAGSGTVPDRMDLFFGLYFLTTGLHAAFLVGGLIVIAWFMLRVVRRKQISPPDDQPIRTTGLYWHLVGLVWFFIFSLYYLIN